MKMLNRKWLAIASTMAVSASFIFLFQNATYKESPRHKQFKIIWHIGTNLETLADAKPGDSRLSTLKDAVDGYYFLVLTGGLLTYWPERPDECRINYKHLELYNKKNNVNHKIFLNGKAYGIEAQERCKTAQSAYYQKTWTKQGNKGIYPNSFANKMHSDALDRVITNLNIYDEQKKKNKKIMSEMILNAYKSDKNTGNFIYDSSSDEILFAKDEDGNPLLPKGYGFLAKHNIFLNRAMTYQEPHWQKVNGNLLRVPLVKGESTEFERRCYFCLPYNLRMIDMLQAAYEREGLPAPRMAVNVRTWIQKDAERFSAYLATHHEKFAGINIEGSFNKMGKTSFLSSIDGAAWFFQNSRLPINLLIPGALGGYEKSLTNSERVRDELLINNLLTYVTAFDQELNKRLGLPAGEHSICNPRFSLVIGSYGDPLHMEPLPLARRDKNGNVTHRAGTIGSQILALNSLREKFCGKAK